VLATEFLMCMRNFVLMSGDQVQGMYDGIWNGDFVNLIYFPTFCLCNILYFACDILVTQYFVGIPLWAYF